LRSQLYSQLYSQLDSQLDSQLGSQLGSQLYSQLGSQLDSQLDSQLGSQLRSQLYSQLDYAFTYLFTMSIYSQVLYSWWSFLQKEFNLTLSIDKEFNECFELHDKSAIYEAIFTEALCIVVKHPKAIHRNAENDLHSISDSAVEWGHCCPLTKWENYFINGRNIPNQYWHKITSNSLSVEEFVKIPNEEHKSSIIMYFQERFGDSFLAEYFERYLSKIDTYVDKKDNRFLAGTKGMNIGVYDLFKGEIEGVDLSFVRCYCPSSERMFFLQTEAKFSSAKDAIASLCQIPTVLLPFLKSIRRQGERFTTFYNKGWKDVLAKAKDSGELEYTPLSGDKYFSIMEFEY